MTDITKELQNYEQNGPKDVLDKLKQEQNEIKEKIHIINVLTIISALKDVVNEPDFKKYHAESVLVKYYRENDRSSNVRIEFKDEDGSQLYSYEFNNRLAPLEKKISGIFNILESNMNFFHTSYTSNDETCQFTLDNDGIELMKKAFLNDKLQTSISYAMLNKQLSEKNAPEPLKPKI